MRRVLIIDDDKAVGNAIRTWLELEGIDVTHLQDGRSGVRAVESGSFDLVIVDLFMPGLNGLETLTVMHRIRPDLPIIVMSGLIYRAEGSPIPEMMQRATALGAVGALCKPFKPRELMRAIETSLGGPLQPDTTGSEPNPSCNGGRSKGPVATTQSSSAPTIPTMTRNSSMTSTIAAPISAEIRRRTCDAPPARGYPR